VGVSVSGRKREGRRERWLEQWFSSLTFHWVSLTFLFFFFSNFTQVVFNRNLQFYLANPGNVLVRLLISFTVGIFQGIVFFRSPAKTPALVQAVALLICLFVTQLQALLLPFVSMTLFIEDRKFFVREAASRLYSTR